MLTDWIQAIFIMSIYSIFLTILTMNQGIQSLQNNWALYRCNPIIMPFASLFAPKGMEMSASDNFTFCIQSMMMAFAPSITQPFEFLQGMTVTMMGNISQNLKKQQQNNKETRSSTGGIFASIYNVFFSVIIQFNLMMVKMMDIQGKITGIMTTIVHVITAVQYTFESMWTGIPGQMIKTLS